MFISRFNLARSIAASKANILNPNIPMIGYNFDSNKSTGHNPITFTGGSLVAPPVALTGYSQVVNASETAVSFNDPALSYNVGTSDYTLEFRFLQSNSGGTYKSIFYTTPSTLTNSNIAFRYGDNGFGNRMQFSYEASALQNIYNTSATKASTLNTWMHIVIQKISGNTRIYFNGVRQNLATATGTSYTQQNIPVAANITGKTAFMFGGSGATSGTHLAEFAFWNKARYAVVGENNFTAIPNGYIVNTNT